MPIKLRMVEDVDDLGRSGDLVNVKPGYARNFLIPQQFAVVAGQAHNKNASAPARRASEKSGGG